MKFAIVLSVLVAQFLNCARLWAMNSVNEQSTFSHLAAELGRLGNVRNPRASLAEAVPRFCWSFEKPHPHTFSLLRQALDEFHGAFHWSLVNMGGEHCLLATVERPNFYRSKHDPERGNIHASSEITKEAAVQDLEKFARFIQSWLDRKQYPKDQQPTTWEPGVYDTWIVVDDPENFSHRLQVGDVGAAEYKMPVGITLSELEAIHTDVLQRQGEGGWSTSKFSLLRRLNDPWDDAWYLQIEIASLKSETQLAMVTASPRARAGLAKLAKMCDAALSSQAGLYFSAN